MDLVIEAKDIGKTYAGEPPFHALRGLDVRVARGEFASIVGKSGCGKSTLLYILSTLDTDYEGELSLLGERTTGRSLDDLAAFRSRNLGFVFQFHYLLPEFTCLRNVMIPGLRLGAKSPQEVEHDAVEKLRLLGLEDQAHKLASRISGGQQQRVAIARALINDPAIVMGDEPTGNLDSRNTRIVFDLFRGIAHDLGKTVLVVTHDPDFARESDRVVEVVDGRIPASDDPA